MIAVTQGLPNQTNQVIRFARFTSKNNIESGIFGIGVRLATHQDYRNIRSELTQQAHEFHAVHVRHEMVGNDQANFLFPDGRTQQRQSATGAGGHVTFNSALAENQLANTELGWVVVQQQSLFHALCAFFLLIAGENFFFRPNPIFHVKTMLPAAFFKKYIGPIANLIL